MPSTDYLAPSYARLSGWPPLDGSSTEPFPGDADDVSSFGGGIAFPPQEYVTLPTQSRYPAVGALPAATGDALIVLRGMLRPLPPDSDLFGSFLFTDTQGPEYLQHTGTGEHGGASSPGPSLTFHYSGTGTATSTETRTDAEQTAAFYSDTYPEGVIQSDRTGRDRYGLVLDWDGEEIVGGGTFSTGAPGTPHTTGGTGTPGDHGSITGIISVPETGGSSTGSSNTGANVPPGGIPTYPHFQEEGHYHDHYIASNVRGGVNWDSFHQAFDEVGEGLANRAGGGIFGRAPAGRAFGTPSIGQLASIPVQPSAVSAQLKAFEMNWEFPNTPGGFVGGRFYMFNDNPNHNCTIGYGHLIHLGPIGSCTTTQCAEAEAKWTAGISRGTAEAILTQDLANAAQFIHHHVLASLSRQQFDALVDLYFNAGWKPFFHTFDGKNTFSDPTKLLNDITSHNFTAVAADIQATAPGGPRRSAEAEMWSNGTYPTQ